MLGINAEGLTAVGASQEAVAARRALAEQIGDRRLILRADRTDLSKNILRGIHAFELLLERHPELVETVHFRMLLNPSRQGVAEYREYLERCLEAAEEIRRRFGPEVMLADTSDDFPAVVAAMQSYDVLFTNAVIDGTNLVAKEGPAVNDRDGVLVLSANAGAATVMGGAVQINPFDVHDQADALHTALLMGAEERADRAALLKAYASHGSPGEWLSAVRAALHEH